MSTKPFDEVFKNVTPPGQTGGLGRSLGDVASTRALDDLEALIERRTMMRFGPERRTHFQATVAARAKYANAASVSEYVRTLVTSNRETEMMALVDDLTINETTFFRNVPQLGLFAQVALPEIIKRKVAANEPKRINIWSAGCSTGQEAYTLACLTSDALLGSMGWTFDVLGTDLSPTVVSVARDARYQKARLDTMPIDALRRHFDDLGETIRVKDQIRSRVTFMQHNLRDAFPEGRFDVIFCRNVMIYFSREEQLRLAREFTKRLNREGFLFIGHSESLQGLDENKLRLRIQTGGVAYQKTS